MTFGGALETLRLGGRVKRPAWKGSFILLQHPDGQEIGNLSILVGPTAKVHWRPSDEDLLADDWLIHGYEAPTVTPLGKLAEMNTSDVVKLGASFLLANGAPKGDMLIGLELQVRADRIAAFSAATTQRCAFAHRVGCHCDALMAIGEVRR